MVCGSRGVLILFLRLNRVLMLLFWVGRGCVIYIGICCR